VDSEESFVCNDIRFTFTFETSEYSVVQNGSLFETFSRCLWGERSGLSGV